MARNKEVLDLAILAGKVLVENGAEIFRVHDTICRIFEAYNLKDYQLFVISNAIFVTIGEDTASTQLALRHIPQYSVNLDRICKINHISREIEAIGPECDASEMKQRIQEFAVSPGPSLKTQVIACSIATGSFAYILGGTLWDSSAALVCGFLLQLFMYFSAHNRISKYIERVLSGALVTLVASLLIFAGIGHSLNSIIIGSIMPLVPGFLLTTAIRDYFNTDFLSGTIHMVDALITAACIAIGVGAMLFLLNEIPGVVL